MAQTYDRSRSETSQAPMLRFPALSKEHVAFAYAGDLWIADLENALSKEGTTARRLTSAPGNESGPRFSPDGQRVAYNGQEQGSLDICTVALDGSNHCRITDHPEIDLMVDWLPGNLIGDKEPWILFASRRSSGYSSNWQLFRVSSQGGMPHRLPLSAAEYGAVSRNGWLAFQTHNRQISAWRRYRGGLTPDLFLWKLDSPDQPTNLTKNQDSNDSNPMWSQDGKKLFFLSDRDSPKKKKQPYRLWVYYFDDDTPKSLHMLPCQPRIGAGRLAAPIRNPSIGPTDEIVFESEGRLYLTQPHDGYDAHHLLNIKIPGRQDQTEPRIVDLGDEIRWFDLSPDGRRAVFEARGRLFTVPCSGQGVTRLLSKERPVQRKWPKGILSKRRFAVADRFPAWCPQGRTIAYFTDDRGESRLAIRQADNGKILDIDLELPPGYYYRPFWSPDGTKIAFIDHRRHVHCCYLENSETTHIVADTDISWFNHSSLEAFRIEWSPCSRWMVYEGNTGNRHDAIYAFDTLKHRKESVTSGSFPCWNPVFDPAGKYLFFLATPKFSLLKGWWNGGWIFANSTRLAALPLYPNVPTFGRLNADGEWPDQGMDSGQVKSKVDGTACRRPNLEFDERRIQFLASVPRANYRSLRAAPGKLFFVQEPNTGDRDHSTLLYSLALNSGQLTQIIEFSRSHCKFEVARDGSRLLVERNGNYYPLAPDTPQKLAGISPLPREDLRTRIHPRAEWRQILHEATRLLRDYFYKPIDGSQDQYSKSKKRRAKEAKAWQTWQKWQAENLELATTRWDVAYVLKELGSHLQTSHTEVGGGDLPRPPNENAGLLGADLVRSDGGFRIAKILESPLWAPVLRSPLADARLSNPGPSNGPAVKEGDVLVRVGNRKAHKAQTPWELLEGYKTGELVEIEFSRNDSRHRAMVRLFSLKDERLLRYRVWVEQRRAYIGEVSNDEFGYLHLRNAKVTGLASFLVQFRSQMDRKGLIFDARFNLGGSDPYGFLDLLARSPIAERDDRYGASWWKPVVVHPGAKVLLVNRWTASSGEIFAHGFRKLGIGKVIGTRTLGATIGKAGSPPLMDGGFITAPNLPLRDEEGNILIEDQGLEPDIPVDDGPHLTQIDPDRGNPGLTDDPKLDQFLAAALEELRRNCSQSEVRSS